MFSIKRTFNPLGEYFTAFIHKDTQALNSPHRSYNESYALTLKSICEAVCALPRYQRKALLLSMKHQCGRSLLIELLSIHAITVEQTTVALEINTEDLNLLLPKLPLNNRAIAEFLSCKEYQVITLKSVASKRILKTLSAVERVVEHDLKKNL
jgi:hypothetical protein